MEKNHTFYPMMTKTLKNLIYLSQFEDYGEIMCIILSYPEERTITKNAPRCAKAVIDELDRQFDRWQSYSKRG